MLASLWYDEEGASMTEYAILAAALVIPILVFMTLISDSAANTLNTNGSALTSISEAGN
jgi:Flp pilus assembly pilin Flp